MTTLQEAARKVLEAWQTSCYGKDAHQIAMVLAMTELRAALAQQGEQQPVCHGCGIPAGDVHMSTCKSGKWPSRVSKGDTAAPAPVVQQPIGYVTPGYFTFGHGIIDERQDEAKCIPVYAAAPAPAPQPAPRR